MVRNRLDNLEKKKGVCAKSAGDSDLLLDVLKSG